MKAVRHLLALVALATLAVAATTASAQFVKGNEAVKVMPDGSKRIETAPLPSTGPIRSTKPCIADAGCNAGPRHMVETNDGLVECTEAYARPGTCRKSSHDDKARLYAVSCGA